MEGDNTAICSGHHWALAQKTSGRLPTEKLQELRYPFGSLFEFLAGGYWLQPQALHLTLGLLAVVVLSVRVLLSKASLRQKLVILSFSTTLFNNPAYTVGGLRLSELFGILTVAVSLPLVFRSMSIPRSSAVGYAILLAGCLFFIHAALIATIYPDIDAEPATQLLRAILIAKVLVVGLVMVVFDQQFTSYRDIDRLMRTMVLFGMVGIIAYLIQCAVYLSGTTPFGTFWDAGFTGFPSFGSVSIERGHFGKFLMPLFPFFLIMLIKHRSVLPFVLFSLVGLINFSASSLSFFVGYITLSLVLFRKEVWQRLSLPIVFVAGSLLGAVGWVFGRQLDGVVSKIVQMVFLGDQIGGRGLDTLVASLSRFPLGTAYGGSTLRTVAGLPEINMGIYAFVAQLSFLAVPILIGFIWLNFSVVRQSRRGVDSAFRRALIVGIAMSAIIYTADVLWFVPTIWAPVVILDKLRRMPELAKEST